jgi:putative cardiolipin synthase
MANNAARAVVLLAALLLAACSTAPFPRGTSSTFLPPANSTQLDRAVAALALAPDESAYRLLRSGEDDFGARMNSAALAERSIDAQYYLWHHDLTGKTMAGELLRAADRGVRVRVLIDDVTARGRDEELAAFDAHPNIEIRVYNPFHSRGNLGVGMEFIFGGGRINHRMHNKLWIADSQLAIVGGRNIGDEYFGAHEDVNFGDLGVMLAGRVIADADAQFDQYWNSANAVPITAFAHPKDPEAAVTKARATLEEQRAQAQATEYGQHLRELRDKGLLGIQLDGMMRGKQVRLVADDPVKTSGDDKAPQVMLDTIVGLLKSAQSNALIISPYFVTKREGTDLLLAMESHGVAVHVLTNSLAANDVASVHGGYSKRREDLLRGGVDIHELKPQPVRMHNESTGSSSASLHAKSIVIDDHVAYVGSFNFDPRSARLNTECGAIIDDPAFASEIRARYQVATERQTSWGLAIENGKLVWLDEVEGKPLTLHDEPPSTTGKRFVAWLFRVLPLDSQL